VDRFLLDYYRKAPFEPRHLWLFAQAFAARDRGPVLLHCTAGKDRTGLLAALILVAAGASPDDIMADFIKTNDVMLKEPHIGRARAMGFQVLGRDPGQRIIMAMLGVEPAHLQAAFEAIEEEAGSIQAYITRLCGMSSGTPPQ
jgi:protein tyrosine/serine phosphatase